MTEPLVMNNGQAPVPAATNMITLREFSGQPIPQQDEDFNFINITDRINALRDQVTALDVNAPVFSYDATTKTLTITQ